MSFRAVRRHTHYELHHRRSPAARRAGLRRPRRAAPPRVARPLLPPAGVVRGGRGPRPGGVPARVAPARDVRGPRVGSRVAVPDRDERLPRRARQAPAAAGRELRARYVECSERADAEGLAALMHEDVRFSMPPTPGVWTGRSTVVQGWIDGGFGSEAFGSMRCVVTRANGQPAVAGYVRKPGDTAHEPLAIDVLRVQDGVVTEIVTFDGAVFEHFDLPATLSAGD